MQRLNSNPSNIKIQMNNFTLNLQTLLTKDDQKLLPTTYRKNTNTQRVNTYNDDVSPLKVKKKTKENNPATKNKSKKQNNHQDLIKAHSKTTKIVNQQKKDKKQVQANLKKIKKTQPLNTQHRSKSRKQKSTRLQRHFTDYDHVIESARLRTSPSIKFFNQNFNSQSISKSGSRSRQKSFKKKQSQNLHQTKSRSKSTFSTNNQRLNTRKSMEKVSNINKVKNKNKNQHQLQKSSQKIKKVNKKSSKSRQRKSIDHFNKIMNKSKSRQRIYTEVSQKHPIDIQQNHQNFYNENFNPVGYGQERVSMSHKKSKSHHYRQQSQNLMSHSTDTGIVLGPKFASNKIKSKEKIKEKSVNKLKTKKMSNTLSSTNIHKPQKNKKIDSIKKQIPFNTSQKQKGLTKQKTSMSSQYNFYQSTNAATNIIQKKKLTQSDLHNYFQKSTHKKSKKLKTQANNQQDCFQSHGLSSIKKGRKQDDEELINKAFKKKKVKNVVEKLFQEDSKEEQGRTEQMRVKPKKQQNKNKTKDIYNHIRQQQHQQQSNLLKLQLPRRTKRQKNLTIQTTFRHDEKGEIYFDDISKILHKKKKTQESISDQSRHSICRSEKSIKEEIMEEHMKGIIDRGHNGYVQKNRFESKQIRVQSYQESINGKQQQFTSSLNRNNSQYRKEYQYQQKKSISQQQQIRRLRTQQLQDSEQQQQEEDYYQEQGQQQSSNQEDSQQDHQQQQQQQQDGQNREQQELIKISSKVQIFTSSDIGRSQQQQIQEQNEYEQKQQDKQKNKKELQELQRLNKRLQQVIQDEKRYQQQLKKQKEKQKQKEKEKEKQKKKEKEKELNEVQQKQLSTSKTNNLMNQCSKLIPDQKQQHKKQSYTSIQRQSKQKQTNTISKKQSSSRKEYKSFQSLNLLQQLQHLKKQQLPNKPLSVPQSPLSYGIQNKQKIISSLKKPRKSIDQQYKIAKTLSNKKLLQQLQLQQTLQKIEKSVQNSLIYEASEYHLLSTSRQGVSQKEMVKQHENYEIKQHKNRQQKEKLTTKDNQQNNYISVGQNNKHHKTIDQLEQELLLSIKSTNKDQNNKQYSFKQDNSKSPQGNNNKSLQRQQNIQNHNQQLNNTKGITINTLIQKQDSPLLSQNQFKRSSPINIFDELDYHSIKNNNDFFINKKQQQCVSIKPFMQLHMNNDKSCQQLQLGSQSQQKNSLDVRRGEYSQLSLQFEKQMDDYLKDTNQNKLSSIIVQKTINNKSTLITINNINNNNIKQESNYQSERSSDEFFYYLQQSNNNNKQDNTILKSVNKNTQQTININERANQQQPLQHSQLIQSQLTQHIVYQLMTQFTIMLTKKQTLLHKFLHYASQINIQLFPSSNNIQSSTQSSKKKPIFDPFQALDDNHDSNNHLNINNNREIINNNRQINEDQFLNYLQSKIYANNDYILNLAYQLFNFVKTSPQHQDIFLNNINKSFGLKPLKTLRWMRKAFTQNQQQQEEQPQQQQQQLNDHKRGGQNNQNKQNQQEQQQQQVSDLSQNQQLQAVFSPILLADFDAQQNEIIFQQVNQQQYYLNHAVYAALNEISDSHRPFGQNGPPVIPKHKPILTKSIVQLQPKILSKLQNILSLRMGRTQFLPDEQPERIIPQSYKRMDQMIVQQQDQKWNQRNLQDLIFQSVYYLAIAVVDLVVNQQVMEIFRLFYT